MWQTQSVGPVGTTVHISVLLNVNIVSHDPAQSCSDYIQINKPLGWMVVLRLCSEISTHSSFQPVLLDQFWSAKMQNHIGIFNVLQKLNFTWCKHVSSIVGLISTDFLQKKSRFIDGNLRNNGDSCGDTVVLLAGQRTCNSQVASSGPDWAPLQATWPMCLCHQAVWLVPAMGAISLDGKVIRRPGGK